MSALVQHPVGISPWDSDAGFLSQIIETQSDIAAVELDPAIIMRMVAERTQKLTGADGASVQLVDGDHLVCREVTGIMLPHAGRRLQMTASLSGCALVEAAAINCPDCRIDPRADRFLGKRAGIRSILVVPMFHAGAAVGVLNVVSARPGAFEQRHVAALRLMGGLVGAALQHATEFEIKKRLLAERTRALAARRESEERFRSSFEHAAIGMALVTLDGRWARVNQSLCDIVGYSEAELLVTDFQTITHPDDLEADLDNVRQLLCGETRDYHMIKRYIHKQGKTVWVLLSVSLVRDEQGQPLYFISQIQDITDRKRAEEALRGSEARFRALASQAPVGIFQCDAAGNNVFVNDRWCLMTGISASAAAGVGWTNALHPDDRERVTLEWERASGLGQELCLEYRYLTPDGKVIWVQGCAVPIRDEAARVVGYLGTSTDLTERKHAEWLERDRREVLELVAEGRPLADVLDRLTHLVERQVEGIAVVMLLDEGDFTLSGSSLPGEFAAAVLGRRVRLAAALSADANEAATGLGVTEIASAGLWNDLRSPALASGLKACWALPIRSNEGGPLGLLTVYSRRPQRPSEAQERMLEMVGKLATISIEHHQTTRQLAYLVRHDPLTGLPNRLLFEDRLQQAIAAARRNKKLLAVLAMDLDRFKSINDTLGHHAGDSILRQFACRVAAALRETDTLARVGGDEFLLLLPELSSPQGAATVAQKIIAVMSEAFFVESQDLSLTSSIGIAMFPSDGEGPEVLQRAADAAMYLAKKRGRNGFATTAATGPAPGT